MDHDKVNSVAEVSVMQYLLNAVMDRVELRHDVADIVCGKAGGVSVAIKSEALGGSAGGVSSSKSSKFSSGGRTIA